MDKKGIILFDIDRTLLDTNKLNKEIITKIVNLLGIDEETSLSVKKKYVASLKDTREFEPEDYIKVLCDEFNFNNPKPLEDVYYGNDNVYKDCVYSETVEVLNELASYRLGIFSEGTKKYQNHKFISLGLKKYFEPDLVFIFDAKDNDLALAKIPEESIIVDDKESICEFLTKNGFKAIWLNKIDNRVSSDFLTIHNLLELRGKLIM